MGPAGGWAQESPPPVPDAGVLRVFIDCQRCPREVQQFLRTEFTYIDFARDRQDGSVHVLVTSERTGSGGQEWTVSFLGQREYVGIEDTLKFATEPADTEEKTRTALAKTLQISQLRSGYNYFVSFGFSYSFGATTNNVVNPRFGR